MNSKIYFTLCLFLSVFTIEAQPSTENCEKIHIGSKFNQFEENIVRPVAKGSKLANFRKVEEHILENHRYATFIPKQETLENWTEKLTLESKVCPIKKPREYGIEFFQKWKKEEGSKDISASIPACNGQSLILDFDRTCDNEYGDKFWSVSQIFSTVKGCHRVTYIQKGERKLKSFDSEWGQIVGSFGVHSEYNKNDLLKSLELSKR